MIFLSQSLYTDIRQFKNSIEEKISYSFLKETIEKPAINEDELFILSQLVPDNGTLSDHERNTYVTTIMLVQIALNTHELVKENSPEETNQEKLVNQLHVLAGDYYSGLYYYLLADIEDLAFIHKLASAIKAINELKIKLHYKEYTTFKEYIQLKLDIQFLLFESVAIYFNRKDLIASIHQWMYISILLKEKNRIEKDEIILNNMLDSNLVQSIGTNKAKFKAIIQQEWLIFQELLNELPRTSEIPNYFKSKTINELDRMMLDVEEG